MAGQRRTAVQQLTMRRGITVVIGVIVGSLGLAGCGSDGDESGDTGGATGGDTGGEVSGTLDLAWRSNDEETGRQVAAAYEEARPGVDVTLDIIPFQSEEFRQTLLTRRMADDLPDIIQSIDRFAPLTADAQISTDVTPYLESGGDVTAELFAQPFLDQYRIGEEIHGLPVTGDAVVLYYNKAHFDEAGLAYPDDTWTWEDLVSAAETLTLGEGETAEQYGFVTTYDWNAMYVPMLTAEGGEFLDDEGHTQLDSDPAAAAFEKLLGPVRDGVFVPQDIVEAQGGDPALVFANGTASMLAGVRGWLPNIREGIQSDFDVAPFPLINGTRANGMGSRSLSLTNSGLENSAVAYDFLDWFYSEEGMQILTQTYAVVPPIETLYDSPIWRDLPAPPENNDAFIQALDSGVIVPNVPAAAQGAIDDGIRTVVDSVLLGDVAVSDALAAANEQINTAIDQAR